MNSQYHPTHPIDKVSDHLLATGHSTKATELVMTVLWLEAGGWSVCKAASILLVVQDDPDKVT